MIRILYTSPNDWSDAHFGILPDVSKYIHVADVATDDLETAWKALQNGVDYDSWRNNPIVTEYNPLASGRGNRSADIGDLFIMEDRTLHVCATCGFELYHDVRARHAQEELNKFNEQQVAIATEQLDSLFKDVELFNRLIAEAKASVAEYKQYDHHFDRGWCVGVVNQDIHFKSGGDVKRNDLVLFNPVKGHIWIGRYECAIVYGTVHATSVGK